VRNEELQLILAEGEGYKIEFKESLSTIDRELVAFANASGGRVFLGVTDDKRVKGITITNKLKSQIQDIATKCQPAITLSFEELQSQNVLIINVREGDDKPYQCSSGFYIRIGSNSQKLTRDEIVKFFKEEGKIKFDELINLKFEYDVHFDPGKLDKFLRLAGISKVLDDPSILVNLGVAEKQEGKVIFNNTGILFFAKKLQDIYFHTTVTCALYKGVEKVEVLDRRDFNEDIVSSIDGAVNFLKQWIPVRDEPTGTPQMKKVPEIPYDALREAIINAVTHRNYFEKGANAMVEMFDDRIEITNPGGLVKGLQPEDFGKRSVLRNPNVANLLHRIQYIEKMGTGISKIRTLMAEAGLSPVEFEFDTFFTATFKRPEREAARIGVKEIDVKFRTMLAREGVTEGVTEGVKKRLITELLYIMQNGSTTRSIIERIGRVSMATAERDVSYLKKLGLIEFEGPPKTGMYVLTDKGKQLILEEMH